MPDIEKSIMETIEKEGITLQDMLCGEWINPSPDRDPEKARDNKFKTDSCSERMLELLDFAKEHVGEKITVQHIFKYWWDFLIDQQRFIGEMLEDVFIHFKDKLMPEQEKDEPGLSVDIDEIAIPEPKAEKAA